MISGVSSVNEEQSKELAKCYTSPAYFVATYCKIFDAVSGDWIPFDLWPAQSEALKKINKNQLTIILKARQLGATWLVLSYALWLMMYRPTAEVLLFSKRDTEAVYLLSHERMRGVYERLPGWMRSGHRPRVTAGHQWTLANGSVARAFSTSSGDSYTASLAIVDEADLSPDLNRLMRSVKPTIDNGGKMILLSRTDKSEPSSEFKRIYTAAAAGENGWTPVFMPWHVHPGRDQVWYDAQTKDILSRTGSLDDLHEQYPASDIEALSPRTLDKRIPAQWLFDVFEQEAGFDPLGIPSLRIFKLPEPGIRYVVGGDPAEGNPTSDDSACTVLRVDTGEEVASLAGKFQPSTFGNFLALLSEFYQDAPVLVERNNHGHAVLLWLHENTQVPILKGSDDKFGYMTTTKSKAQMYADLTDAVRDGEVRIHSQQTYLQLASIDGNTLSAPTNEYDDRAISFALAWQAVLKDVSKWVLT